MQKAQESQILESKCDKNGMRILTFSRPNGPFFHYEEPSSENFGDQPLEMDPLDKKYLVIKNSTSFDSAGQGAFAVRKIEKSQCLAIFSGVIFEKTEKFDAWAQNGKNSGQYT